MITFLAWHSIDVSPRLTPVEVEQLSNLTFSLMQMGQLSKGYRGASAPLYWQRLKQGE